MKNRNRKSNRLQYYDYSQNGIYFVTICTKDREELFGKIIAGKVVLNECGEIVKNKLIDISNYFENIFLDEFIIMPNHVHAIIEIINNIVGTDLVSVRNPGKSQGIRKSQNPEEGQTPGAGQIQDLSLRQFNDGFVGTDNVVGTDLVSVRNPESNIKFGLLSRIMQIFKSKSAVEYIQLMKSKNETYTTKIWQRSFYDHIIRNEIALNKIREYIISNPKAWDRDRNNIENIWM